MSKVRGPIARRNRRVRKRLLVLLSIFVVFLIVAAGLLTSWFVNPPQKQPAASDAVVVIAGIADGRHAMGASLVQDGIAPNFVVSNPLGTEEPVGSSYCRGDNRPSAAEHTFCMDPQPVTTTGEAMTMGALAKEEGWSSATLVTSRVHARRVAANFEKCTDLDVNVMYTNNLGESNIVYEIAHETGGMIKLLLSNPC
ncbi:YdcF family protein [Corynebacterium lubricantis]|uniref:YdcF family protein n=1 Tax=Corynebacterium lubricantis TaxID=541095 RepID=UPI0005242CD5|nr:ElyC/SanA/YdcF family protein [Corynebacterium lubricantis]